MKGLECRGGFYRVFLWHYLRITFLLHGFFVLHTLDVLVDDQNLSTRSKQTGTVQSLVPVTVTGLKQQAKLHCTK